MTATVMKEALDERDRRKERPLRVEGTSTLQELDSFVALANRFKRPSSAVFADIDATKLTAIFDYHDPTGEKDGAEIARWGKHRAVYTAPRSRQWQAWVALEGKPLTQDQFAAHLEANLDDLTLPPEARAKSEDGVAREYGAPARVLDMARRLQIFQKGEFSRAVDPVNGNMQLVVRQENEPQSTKIYGGFWLGIPVFEAGAPYAVEARIQFRMIEARPTFAYALHQKDEVLRHAFGEVRARVVKDTGLPLFAGRPE